MYLSHFLSLWPCFTFLFPTESVCSLQEADANMDLEVQQGKGEILRKRKWRDEGYTDRQGL